MKLLIMILLYDLIDNSIINDIISLDNNKSLVSLIDNDKFDEVMISNTCDSNISIAVASAITSYSRIFMTQLKK